MYQPAECRFGSVSLAVPLAAPIDVGRARTEFRNEKCRNTGLPKRARPGSQIRIALISPWARSVLECPNPTLRHALTSRRRTWVIYLALPSPGLPFSCAAGVLRRRLGEGACCRSEAPRSRVLQTQIRPISTGVPTEWVADDCPAILQNARLAARVAREGKCSSLISSSTMRRCSTTAASAMRRRSRGKSTPPRCAGADAR
jgi:hypothetical protein